jgi:hypothetical protein
MGAQVVGLVFCNRVILDQPTGLWSMVDLFNSVASRRFPSPARQIFVYSALTGLAGDHK